MKYLTHSIILFAGLTFPAGVAGSKTSLFPDIQRVLDAGALRVAVIAQDIPPMVVSTDDGLSGFDVDLARDLAGNLGVRVEFVRTSTTYDGVVDVVAQGRADIGVSLLSSDVRRALKVQFSRPYVRQSYRLFFNRRKMVEFRRTSGQTGAYAFLSSSFARANVGVVTGSVYQRALLRDYPDTRPVPFPDFPSLLAAVRAGELVAGLHGAVQIGYFMRKTPQLAIHLGVDQELRNSSDIKIVVRPDAPHLRQWIDIFLENRVGQLEAQALVLQQLQKEAAETRASN